MCMNINIFYDGETAKFCKTLLYVYVHKDCYSNLFPSLMPFIPLENVIYEKDILCVKTNFYTYSPFQACTVLYTLLSFALASAEVEPEGNLEGFPPLQLVWSH